MKPVIYAATTHGRCAHVALAMQQGFKRHGFVVPIMTRMPAVPQGDVALAYGWLHRPAFEVYRAAGGHFAYWDLGYWNRSPDKSKGGTREGAYRLAINSWDTADHMRRGCPDDRWRESGLALRPRGPHGRAVLVPGMSDKAAGTHGFYPMQWERQMLARLERLVPGDVLFRPKTARLTGMEPIDRVLQRCRAVVTNHSNVALDAIIAGVPCIATKGVGRLLTVEGALDIVEATGIWPECPSDDQRQALVQDVAYAQWTPAEMRTGAAWDHIRGILS